MKKTSKRIVSYLLIWRNLVSFILYVINKKNKDDLVNYLHLTPFDRTGILSLNYALLFIKPYRSVFRYRNRKCLKWSRIIDWLTPWPLDTIEIGGEIDTGLAIWHNMGAVVAPQKAGKNLSVGQCVTIGRGDKPNSFGQIAPIIGDNVRICTGSIVFGGITIGNNVIIGAGTVLCKSIPDNCVVVGNPARIIKKNGVSIE